MAWTFGVAPRPIPDDGKSKAKRMRVMTRAMIARGIASNRVMPREVFTERR